MRREKEIAESSRKLAESENLRHKQLLESSQRQLSSVQAELKELCDTATSRTQTAAEHQEILKKVGRLVTVLLNPLAIWPSLGPPELSSVEGWPHA